MADEPLSSNDDAVREAAKVRAARARRDVAMKRARGSALDVADLERLVDE